MIVVLKKYTTAKDIKRLKEHIQQYGLMIKEIVEENTTMLVIINDTTKVDITKIAMDPSVEKIMHTQTTYETQKETEKKHTKIVNVSGVLFGDGNFPVIAGPCAVESEEQILAIAHKVKSAGASILRGGAFKPRTNPYTFQGLGLEGLDYLVKAREITGLPICSELMTEEYLDIFIEKVDMIQIGTRNMQNFGLLKQLGRTKKPILLKRGLSATYEEWLMAAEYIINAGNPNVILCERGIRTFEHYTRNTLDIQAIPVIKHMSDLPIIIDPSHAGGKWWLVPPMAKASFVAGGDGIMIEVHEHPEKALTDGEQSLTIENFEIMMGELKRLKKIMGSGEKNGVND